MPSFAVGVLPDDPLAASAEFHARVLPQVLDRLSAGESPLTLVFAPAGHAHRDWRKAAVATLARERAPARVNGVASDDTGAIAAALDWLEQAPAITGHYLPLDGAGAGSVVS